MTASKLSSGDKLARRGAAPWMIIAAAAIIVVIVASAVLIPGLTSGGMKSANSASSNNSGTTTTSSKSTGSGSNQASGSVSCVTVVPYDSIQKQFGGCGYTFAALFNGAPYTQTLSNGSVEMNSGWTLLIEASQNCRCGPSENVTFGWDPAGPVTASGERLPGPASSTLLGGNLTMQWRLYGSTDPLLYAWIFASTISASQETTSTESTSATSCTTAPWPSQVSTSYQSVVQQIEQNPAFVALTNGLCYSFTLNYYGESGGQSLTTFVFNQYNGTVFYPCGTFPANLTVSQIQVTVFSGTTTNEISSMWLDNQTASLNVYSCPLANNPLWVHSVLIVPPYTPAGPTVEVTLRANLEQAQITNLTAVLALTGREPFQSQTQTFRFVAVNASNPLLAGQSASQTETIIGPVTIYSDYLYSMNISGTFQNGQTFTYGVQVEIVNGPAPGTGSPSSPASCLKQVPGSASITSFANATFAGYEVTFANGTRSFFSLDSCPVPVNPDLYSVASTIESNPGFIAAEGGGSYELSPLGPAGMSNLSGSYSIYMFYLYSDQRVYPCGGTFWTYTQLGEIQVMIPINSTTGSLELSRMQLQTIPGSELNVFLCTTTATTAGSQTG